MGIREELQTILDGYVSARQRQPFPGGFKPVFDRLASAVAALPSLRQDRRLQVRAGFGIGQWSRAPWVCIMDSRSSVSPQGGVFVSLKFRQDMAGFYLSLNQGHGRDVVERGRKEARAFWQRRAERLRALAPGLGEAGFRLDGAMDLGLDDARAAEDFAASTIAWTYHSAEALPDEALLDRQIGALLEPYRRWLDQGEEEPTPLDPTALQQMRAGFLRHMLDFVSFAEPGLIYPKQERSYKDELAAALRDEVLPLFAAPFESIEAAETAIGAIHTLLTRRKLGGELQGVQNLVNWRATEHLRRLRGEEALQAARLYAHLLKGPGDTPERLEAFSTGYLPILAQHMKSGLQGVSRSLPTLLLMLAQPETEIFVRTTLFDTAAQRLLGHRLLSPEPLTAGDYAACRDFAQRLRGELEGWGWQPRDMIDVQSFLWVADPASYADPTAPSDDLAFRDALDPASERRIYKIAPGQQARFWEECREGGFICVGWDEVGDLREFGAEDEEAFIEIFRQAFGEDYIGSTGRLATGTRKAREVWLLRDIQPGDIILATRGIGEVLAMGEVVEPGYDFDPSRQEYRHLVRVRWNENLRRSLDGILPTNQRVVWANNTVVPVERELYAAILEGRPAKLAPTTPSHEETAEAYARPSFPEIATAIGKSGLRLGQRMIRRYHAAVQARGFVVLAGASGTGKTWLAESYADAVGARLLLVRVAPNWHSNEDLLGYVSPLNNEYQHTAFSEFLIEAERIFLQAPSPEAARPCHVLLDEMNLARVEHYFADFLSALEQRNRYGEATLSLGSRKVGLHRNLVFIGTVNMDETTHGFAQKVYDRAQLLEVELDAAAFSDHVRDRRYARDLELVRAAVAEVAPIAFRTADDVADYTRQAVAVGAAWEEAFDEAMLQKVLPRIGGMEPAVGEALQRLIEVTEGRYPLSHSKAKRMLEGFRLGVASFF